MTASEKSKQKLTVGSIANSICLFFGCIILSISTVAGRDFENVIVFSSITLQRLFNKRFNNLLMPPFFLDHFVEF